MYRVYVSRLPSSWNELLIKEHFTSVFGPVESAERFCSSRSTKLPTKRGIGNVCYSLKNDGKCDRGADCPFSHEIEAKKDGNGNGEGEGRGQEEGTEFLDSGSVTFTNESDMRKAIEQGSIHVSKKTIRIQPFQSRDDGRDAYICHAWKAFNCVRGDSCKFSHDGKGACTKQSDPYHGRKFQCLSWKSKGKCSKGENCSFLHLESVKKKTPSEAKKGMCDNFKKGKCRKGDKCKYSHDIPDKKGSDDGEKRKRIDGNMLVQKRKKIFP